MENIEYAIAYKEVLEILKSVPNAEYNKIPKDKIELFEKMQNKNYSFKYDSSKTLDEQNVSKRAKTIIGILFRDYWATDIQREKILAKQKYERNKIEEHKKQNYQYEDIFKKNRTKMQQTKIKDTVDDISLVEYKENILTKILYVIKSFFKRNKNNTI